MPSPDTTRRPVIILATILVLAILGYGAFRAESYIRGPQITVLSPLRNEATSSPTILISGKTDHVAYLTINGLEVPLHEDSSFAVLRALPAGYTVITLNAKDKFGREVVQEIPVVGTTTISPNANATTTHGSETKNKEGLERGDTSASTSVNH